MTAYEDMIARFKEMTLIDTATGIIHWDMETNMPPRGIDLRSEQLGALSRITHRMAVDPENGKLLDEAEKDKGTLDEVGKRNLYLMRKTYDEQTRLPEKLVGDLTRQQAIATETWKKARAGNDWKMFEPELQKLVDLSIERADLLKDVKGASTVYDTMIDDFEPKMTADEISRIFAELRDGLVPMTQKFAGLTSKVDASFLSREIPVDVQRLIAADLCGVIGYDISSEKAGGRIDEVEHPFTTGYFDDVRITVKYHTDKFDSAVFAILHEGGHALYEQGLTTEYFGTPLCDAISLGIHESQSRLWENYIGRGRPFWEYYYPQLQEVFHEQLGDIDLDRFYAAVNTVRPSFIRTEADEVTYNLHIMLRFDLERDMLNGKIKAGDLPELWGIGMMDSLGIKPSTDADGVLQDIHWSLGALGYFPTYALGDIYGRQIFEAACSQIVNFDERIALGDLKTLREWLRKNIHSLGRAIDANELLISLTGESLSVKPFINYLREKFGRLYNL